MRTSSMIVSLAEHYLRDEMAGIDWDALVQAMDTMAPRTASEDFAYCVALRAQVATALYRGVETINP